jgi:hypothetical protein
MPRRAEHYNGEVNVLRSLRFSIAGLMITVLVVAIGVAALRQSSPMWAGLIFLLTCGVLSLGTVAVAFRREYRAWWFGFSLFGWSYLAISLWSLFYDQPTLPTESVLKAVAPVLGPGDARFVSAMAGVGAGPWSHGYLKIGHCLWALAAALFGGALSHLFFGRLRNTQSTDLIPESLQPRTASALVSWWFKPAVFASAGFGAVALVLCAGSTLDPSIWAGMVFVLTVGLISLACVGACLGRGRQREVWLGTALFGGGFMVAAFARSPATEGWPSHPTVELLNAIRTRWRSSGRGASPASSVVAELNTRIFQALEQPVTMRFAGDSLADVIKYIQYATQSADGHVIQVYVDPVPPELGEIFKRAPLKIDVEGIPLQASLRLCLEQLDLTYEVHDGMLFIASTERQEALRRQVVLPLDHSYLVAGHCVLALIAAVIGGVLAPIVSDRRPVSTPTG